MLLASKLISGETYSLFLNLTPTYTLQQV